MSQYAVVPAGAVPATIEDCLATPESWTVKHQGDQWGGYEKERFTTIDIDNILAVGGEWFGNAHQLQQWMESETEYIAGKRATAYRDYKVAREALKQFVQEQGFENLALPKQKMAARWFACSESQIDTVLTLEEQLDAGKEFDINSRNSRQQRYDSLYNLFRGVLTTEDGMRVLGAVQQHNLEFMYVKLGFEGDGAVNYKGEVDQPGLLDFLRSNPGTPWEASGLTSFSLSPKHGMTIEDLVNRGVGIIKHGNY